LNEGIFDKHIKGTLAAEEKRKQQILDTAALVFARLGYAATIDQIAEEMGVTKGHIYYYFNSKQDILFQIFRQAMSYFLAEIAAVNTPDLPPDYRLKAIFKKHIMAICENRAIMTVFMDLRRDLLPDNWREIAASRNRYENLLQDLIREGMEKGYFTAINEKIVSYTLLGSINWVYVWFHENGELRSEEVADIMAEYLLRGIKKWPELDIAKTGKTITELSIGEEASFSKSFTEKDLHNYSGISGDYLTIDNDAQKVIDNGIISSLIFTVIKMILPGPGSIVVETTFRHHEQVNVGDAVTAKVKIVKINLQKNMVEMELSWFNQGNKVAEGFALVQPPVKKLKTGNL